MNRWFASHCANLLPALILGAALPSGNAHPDKIESGLLLHYATGVHPIENGEWPDLTHRLTARVVGGPKLASIGPAQALTFNGSSDWLLAAADFATAEPALPKKEFSVAAWVVVNETLSDGGIIGFMQDNGDFEKGWLLGFDQKSFSLILSTEGSDDGNGKLTRLNGRTPIETGRWHYVVGTYDGATMRLYVDGKPDGEATGQSGNVLYPERGRYAVAAYADDNELYPLDGALFEVKVYNRVMAPNEIAGIALKNEKLLAHRSSINKNLQFVVKPYLQFGTTNSMRILCETDKPSRMKVAFGEMQPLASEAAAEGTNLINEVRLADLKPYARYFYRVTCEDASGNLARSDIFSFQTAPGADQAWAFGILGDTQRNPDVTRRCAEGIFALRPNFMLHCGDVVDDGFAKQQWVFDLFEPCSTLFAYVPVFPVIGNHERNSHWYYDYFSLPDPEYFYTYTYGNAQFFMIDSNKDCSPGSDQYRRIEKALSESKAVWKFTAHHHPCFSADENDYGDHLKGKAGADFTWGDSNVRQLVPLYEKYGVDIAFAGHIHSYERTWPILQMTINQARGVRYIVSGGGGGGLEQAAPQRSWFTLHVARGHHYCFASVHDRTIQFKAYDLNGRLFDTFELTKSKDR